MEMSDDFKSLSKKEEPHVEGYQLIGDSLLLRYCEGLLNLKRKEKNGVFHLGFCVSGQTISELHRRLENRFQDISENVILMIGTNDLLRDTSCEAMQESFDKLLTLLFDYAKKIILLTIPPVPKLKNDENHWYRLKEYNNFIRQCGDDKHIFVADAYAEFIVPKTPSIKSSSRSNSPNYSRGSKSTPILNEKCRSTALANGNIVRRRITSSSPSGDDDPPPPSKRCRPRLQLLPSDRSAKIVEKTNCRRPFSGDLKNFNEACHSKAIEQCSSQNWNFARRVLGGIFNDLRKPTSDSDCSSTVLRKTPPSEGKSNSSSFPPTSSCSGDHSVELRDRLVEKRRSCGSSIMSSAGCGDSFKSSSRRYSLDGKGGSYHTPRSPFSSSEDLSSNRLRRSTTCKRNDNFDGIPTTSSVYNSHTTPPRKSLTYENVNLFARTEDNHDDCYGRESVEDEVNVENADRIREECFEKYFGRDNRRPDLIHLNARGLCRIKGIIEIIIDKIEGTCSELREV